MKNSTRWIDPGAEYPWLVPAPEEPPDRDEQPDRQQLDRQQLDLTDLLTAQSQA